MDPTLLLQAGMQPSKSGMRPPARKYRHWPAIRAPCWRWRGHRTDAVWHLEVWMERFAFGMPPRRRNKWHFAPTQIGCAPWLGAPTARESPPRATTTPSEYGTLPAAIRLIPFRSVREKSRASRGAPMACGWRPPTKATTSASGIQYQAEIADLRRAHGHGLFRGVEPRWQTLGERLV